MRLFQSYLPKILVMTFGYCILFTRLHAQTGDADEWFFRLKFAQKNTATGHLILVNMHDVHWWDSTGQDNFQYALMQYALGAQPAK